MAHVKKQLQMMIHAVLDTSHELLHYARFIPAPTTQEPEEMASFESLLEKHFLCLVLLHSGPTESKSME